MNEETIEYWAVVYHQETQLTRGLFGSGVGQSVDHSVRRSWVQHFFSITNLLISKSVNLGLKIENILEIIFLGCIEQRIH